MRILSRALVLLVISVIVQGSAKHPCDRRCKTGETLECHFEFHVEQYVTMGKACFDCPRNATDCWHPECVTGDGTKKPILTVNRQMPGTPVAVCQGDKVVVNVINEHATEATTVHFHGEHFEGNQYMDGTPYVTQCPILPGASFRYSFEAKVAGTMFHHSHMQYQRGDGMFGAYIVRQPLETDPNSNLYDYDLTEHAIIVNEYLHTSTVEAFGLLHLDNVKPFPKSILVNGRGKQKLSLSRIPLSVFKVQSGKRYRFRVIAPGIQNCPIQLSIEDHPLTIIASDTGPLKPITVDSFLITPGERYDFVISANQTTKTNYIMRFGGWMNCMAAMTKGEALLVYDQDDVPNHKIEQPFINGNYKTYTRTSGTVLAPVNYAPENDGNFKIEGHIPISDTELHPDVIDEEMRDILGRETPDKTFYLGTNMLPKKDPRFHPEGFSDFVRFKLDANTTLSGSVNSPQINNISLILPAKPLLFQEHEVDPDLFCDENSMGTGNCTFEWCACIHRLEANPGDVVEIFLVDEGLAFDTYHPMHLHGQSFHVLAMERFAKHPRFTGPVRFPGNSINIQDIKMMNLAGKIKRKLDHPPLKDTVVVPDGGYTLIRFRARPGYWIFHCHLAWHNHLGMGVVLKVGDMEKDVPPRPLGVPTC